MYGKYIQLFITMYSYPFIHNYFVYHPFQLLNIKILRINFFHQMQIKILRIIFFTQFVNLYTNCNYFSNCFINNHSMSVLLTTRYD